MSLTINERKERYYQLVLEKANKTYALWRTERIKSKKLVAQANEYAFNERLRADAVYRHRALIFTVALRIRLDKRYKTFFRKLFLLFAYVRERRAFERLKAVLGFTDYNDMREMIDVEAEYIIIQLADLRDRDATGGGKRLALGDITLDEELENFLEECIQEDEQKSAEHEVEADKLENVDNPNESLSMKTDDMHREKISVGLELTDQVYEQKAKDDSEKRVEEPQKQTAKADETEKTEKIEKQVEKTVASTSIVGEMSVLSQEREETVLTPHPVFRETTDGKTEVRVQDDSALSKENLDTKPTQQQDEKTGKDIRVETEREKSPFPVFNKGKTVEVKAPETAPKREVIESKGLEVTADLPQSNISAENQARIALNVTMSREEIVAITEQLMVAFELEAERREQAWREKIAIEQDNSGIQQSPKETAPVLNKGSNAPIPKK